MDMEGAKGIPSFRDHVSDVRQNDSEEEDESSENLVDEDSARHTTRTV